MSPITVAVRATGALLPSLQKLCAALFTEIVTGGQALVVMQVISLVSIQLGLLLLVAVTLRV